MMIAAKQHEHNGRCRVGVVGTGFMARRFYEYSIKYINSFNISAVLSRRSHSCSPWISENLFTMDVEKLADRCDVVFDASGDATFATDVCLALCARRTPLVTMNCEFHVSVGSYFADQMMLTEAAGDQPATAAKLHADALSMGFQPRAHINYKNFLNHNPTPEDMKMWSERQGIRLDQVVAFTDGSKLQIEQAVTANGLGLDIAREGLGGGRCETGFDLSRYADAAIALKRPIADFAQAADAPPGVALVAEHPEIAQMRDHMAFKKLHTPDQRFVVLQVGYHLVHIEAARTIAALLSTPQANWLPIINNSAQPSVGVGAVAKRRLRPSSRIRRGLGSFDVRGVALRLRERIDHVPICLLNDAVLRRTVEPGDLVTFDDVEMTWTPALEIHAELMRRLTARASVNDAVKSS